MGQDDSFDWSKFESEDRKLTPSIVVKGRVWKNWETCEAVDFEELVRRIEDEKKRGKSKVILVEGHLISRCPKLMKEIFDGLIYVDIDAETQWERRYARAKDLAKKYPNKEGMGMDTNYEVLPVYAFPEDREKIQVDAKKQHGKNFGKLAWLRMYFEDVLWPSTESICKASKLFQVAADKGTFLEIKATNDCTKEEWLKRSCDRVVGTFSL